jgi:hypothetical protein
MNQSQPGALKGALATLVLLQIPGRGAEWRACCLERELRGDAEDGMDQPALTDRITCLLVNWHRHLKSETSRAAEDRGTWEAEEKEAEASGPVTLAETIERFKRDAVARGLKPPMMKEYRVLFDQLTTFAGAHGVEYISDLEDADLLMRFRATWKDTGVSATACAAGFTRYCRRST